MAIVLSDQSVPTEYAWGWQVRFELRDEATDLRYSADSLWAAYPSIGDIAEVVAQHVRRTTAEVYPAPVVPPDPEWNVVCENGTEVRL